MNTCLCDSLHLQKETYNRIPQPQICPQDVGTGAFARHSAVATVSGCSATGCKKSKTRLCEATATLQLNRLPNLQRGLGYLKFLNILKILNISLDSRGLGYLKFLDILNILIFLNM